MTEKTYTLQEIRQAAQWGAEHGWTAARHGHVFDAMLKNVAGLALETWPDPAGPRVVTHNGIAWRATRDGHLEMRYLDSRYGPEAWSGGEYFDAIPEKIIPALADLMAYPFACPTCEGTGTLTDTGHCAPCKTCHGSGKLSAFEAAQ